jgi:hypothetical protein
VYGGRAKLFDLGRLIDADETVAANIASADAIVYADAVDSELKEWNKVKPTGIPAWPISMSSAEGKALVNLRHAKMFDKAAAKMCFNYLVLRRQTAIDQIQLAQKWYESVPLEADTHKLEKDIREILKLAERQVDAVAKSSGVLKDQYLPKPCDWSQTM